MMLFVSAYVIIVEALLACTFRKCVAVLPSIVGIKLNVCLHGFVQWRTIDARIGGKDEVVSLNPQI